METEKISIYHDVVGHHFEVQLEDVKAIVEYDEHIAIRGKKNCRAIYIHRSYGADKNSPI